MEQLKISNLFKELICFDEVNKPKPDCESFYLIYQKLNVSPKNYIYIGDDHNDAIPWQKCGMIFFGITTTLLREDFAMIKEYFLFDSLNSIELFFRQLCLLRMFTNRYPNGVKEMILDSESILEKTKNLSQIIKLDPISGMKLLLSADKDSLKNIIKIENEIKEFKKNIKEVVKNNNKIHFFGCGSSGRLLVLVERMLEKML